MEKRWRDARHVNYEEIEKGLLPIPEPMHRVSALSSGVSLRHKKRATLESIKQACFAFERKCAGKYSSKTLAARYLFDLSREVQSMLSDIAHCIKEKDIKMKYLEDTMREWEENFSPVHTLLPHAIPGTQLAQQLAIEEEEEEKASDHVFLDKKHTAVANKKPLDAVRIVTPARLKKLMDEYVKEISGLRQALLTAEKEKRSQEKTFLKELSHRETLLREQFHMEQTFLEEKAEKRVKQLETEHKEAIEQLKAQMKSIKMGEKDLHRQIKVSGDKVRSREEQIKALEAENKHLEKLYREQKVLVKQKWDGLLTKAKKQVAVEHEAQVHTLRQQVISLQSKENEVEEVWANRFDRVEEEVVRPLEDNLDKERMRNIELEQENEYLRSRVHELNRVVRALQEALKSEPYKK